MLLTGAVDYAGLFPPAQLDMTTAVRNYAAYRNGEHAWALGRFIVPVSRLTEFEQAFVSKSNSAEWHISALAGASLDQDVATIFAFNKRRLAVIDTLEAKSSTTEDVRVVASAVPSVLTTYVEIPLHTDPSPLVAAIGKSGLRAKVRTGGTASDAFPSSANLGKFIYACARAGVPFKATAGLHHPLRATYRLTYEPDSPTGIMYGFLNVLIAAGVARSGGSFTEVVTALEEQSAAALRVNDSEISWRQYRFDLASVKPLRSELAISFGSCSFEEPIGDLKLLGLL